MIPKLIHQTWKDDDLPVVLRKIVEHNKNVLKDKGYEFRLWTDANIQDIIYEHYPHITNIFQSTLTGVQRGDIGRLILVHHYGGIYIDLDILLLQDLENLIDFNDDKLYITYEPEAQTIRIYDRNDYICNAFFASNKNNKLLEFAISNIQAMYQKYGRSIMNKFDAFGGNFLNEIIKAYPHFHYELNVIENREMIFPINDPKFNDLPSSKTDWDLIRYKNYHQNAIMVHYWIHGDFESKNLLKNFNYNNAKDIQDNVFDFFCVLYPKNYSKMF